MLALHMNRDCPEHGQEPADPVSQFRSVCEILGVHVTLSQLIRGGHWFDYPRIALRLHQPVLALVIDKCCRQPGRCDTLAAMYARIAITFLLAPCLTALAAAPLE